MSRLPRATVIMAAHNAEETISEAIESILAQTMSDWELVIVDDGSQDRTAEIAESYTADARIRLISIPTPGGSGAARNQAIRIARAPVLFVQDADDIALPYRLAVQLGKLEGDPGLSVVGGQVAEFGLWGGPVRGSWPTDDKAIDHRISDGRMAIAHCAAAMRKSAVEEVGGYDEACLRAQDYALFLRLKEHRFGAVDDVVVYYRTARPVPLRYAIVSGRYGKLARQRAHARGAQPTAPVHGIAAIPTDARSLVGWIRRNARERLQMRSLTSRSSR
ncbi:glycosyltransferase family 2 protein [Demequina rhizosphaerae]|uniref:glycosyltransferase family 2 protein n=1 Tax=Demequina rhizosphaerae TaxID=1638985 RepID=UPI000AB506E2|nr:glycosyltransferase family 2 protein [Demequina rhizosphaerae]